MGACGSAGAGSRVELVVSAASSLTDVFSEMELEFEISHPDVDVVVNIGGSSALATQILEGAPVDVFASADTANMDLLVEAARVIGVPRLIAGNSLAIAVPSGNPANVTGLTDFAREELFLGLCDQAVPCGELAREVLARAGVTPSVDTNEPDVRALLTKISAGELDAGITYVTDLAAAGHSVDGVTIPDHLNVIARYPIAIVSERSLTTAQSFVDFVLSPEGQAILGAHRFPSP